MDTASRTCSPVLVVTFVVASAAGCVAAGASIAAYLLNRIAGGNQP